MELQCHTGSLRKHWAPWHADGAHRLHLCLVSVVPLASLLCILCGMMFFSNCLGNKHCYIVCKIAEGTKQSTRVYVTILMSASSYRWSLTEISMTTYLQSGMFAHVRSAGWALKCRNNALQNAELRGDSWCNTSVICVRSSLSLYVQRNVKMKLN